MVTGEVVVYLCNDRHDGRELRQLSHERDVLGLKEMGGQEEQADIDARVRQSAERNYSLGVLLFRHVFLALPHDMLNDATLRAWEMRSWCIL